MTIARALDKPILAPSRRVNFGVSRSVCHKVHEFIEVVATGTDYLVWLVDEEVSDEFGLPCVYLRSYSCFLLTIVKDLGW